MVRVSEDVQRQTRELSARELTAQFGEQLSRLLKDEIALARAELFASARRAILGGGLLATAAVLGLGAWGALVAAAIAGIAAGLPVWASALIIAGALGALAGVLALVGRSRLTSGVPPLRMTADSVRKEIGELTATTAHRGQR
jgi:putative superfamily III holin-X